MPIKDDLDLQSSHIQSLASRDEVTALFTRLGYNTNARLTQTADAMGLTSDSLKRDVRHIERIADHEDGALQVYLAELKSLTIAHTQALARAMRNRAGDFLWVLTSDYQRLDFVYVERILPERLSDGSINLRGPTVRVRPRVLTVDRRNPGPVELRVLRRFSYTEADADYQIQKLKSAYTIAEWSEPLFNNRALFSDYYLNVRLKDTPEWVDSARMAPALRQLQGMMVDVRRRVSGQPEEVARRTLIEPVLRALGFDLKPGKHSASNAGEPDYFLHRDGTDKPIAYCLAYVWARNLDGRDDEGRDPKTADENPGALIVSLLDRDDAPDWAIVTNGKTWRLYSRQAHSRATNYYEIDLEETIASPDPGLAFRYFWLFFNASSFAPDPNRAGKSFLAWLFDECNLYARELEERLKDRVFGEIFPHFAEGFIEHMGGSDALLALSEDERAQRLSDVHHATLTFLYRLLFLLYAEARNLLPVKETRDYYEISLTHLKEEIARHAGTIDDEVESRLQKAYRVDVTGLYDRLLRLFMVIDQGDPNVNVPIYNGGLFQTDLTGLGDLSGLETSRFLLEHKIPDRFLAAGLDRMARDVDLKRGDLVFIDYKSLGVRQLGSIYEGLLEFKLRVAAEKMAVVRGKKADEIIPYAEAKKGQRAILKLGRGRSAAEWTLSKGEVYLENDRRERKATGSYYTPDYIVKYIVRHTVGPVLDEKFEANTPRIRQAQKRFQNAVERKLGVEKVPRDLLDQPGLLNDIAGDVLRDLFDVKVLDPAMGSGHFLVEAVDFITDRMVQFMNRFVFLSHFFAGTRGAILDAMEQQEVTINRGRLTDVNLLKRHVLKRCIYGVDLNPMAVELAKVSLWLDCFTLGAPLSFLDHHLKCGNSLIGARISEVQVALEMAAEKDKAEIPMLAGLMGSQFAGVMLATDLMRHVSELSDVTAEQVQASRDEFRRASDALAPFERIMDVYISRWFGNADTKLNQPTIDFLRNQAHEAWLKDPHKHHAKLKKDDQRIAETALAAAEEKRFFHWELEFPEVFFGPAQGTTQKIVLKESGGFDAVIGNPPYDLLKRDPEKPSLNQLIDFVRQRLEFEVAISSMLNVFHLFVLRTVGLAAPHRLTGQIVPLSILSDPSASGVRRKLIEEHHVLDVQAFPQKDDENDRVFPEAKLSTVILIIQTQAQTGTLICRVHPGKYILQDSPTLAIRIADVERLDSEYLTIPLGNSDESKVLQKLISQQDVLPLGNAIRVLVGEIDMTLDRDCVQANSGPHELLKGAHLQRYLQRDKPKQGEQEWVDLVAFRQKYGTASPKSNLFQRPRVAFQGVTGTDDSRRLKATLVPKDFFLANSLNWVNVTQPDVDALFILSLLNSQLFEWRFRLTSTNNNVNNYEIEALPYHRIAFTTPTKRRTQLAEQGRTLYARGLAEHSHAPILAFAHERLMAQPEESDVVHGLLAFLAEQMIDLNKRKQSEQKRFLGWLEGALKIKPDSKGKAGLDALSGKTTIRNYLGDYQKGEESASSDDMEDVLFKNRSRLGVSLSDARFVAKLRSEYEKSLAVLLPIKGQLAWTDRLIDLVVYRLYGLTEEEIAVVEGRK